MSRRLIISGLCLAGVVISLVLWMGDGPEASEVPTPLGQELGGAGRSEPPDMAPIQAGATARSTSPEEADLDGPAITQDVDGGFIREVDSLSDVEFEVLRDAILVSREEEEEDAKSLVEWTDEVTFEWVRLKYRTTATPGQLDRLSLLGRKLNGSILDQARVLAAIKADTAQRAWDSRDIYPSKDDPSVSGVAPDGIFEISYDDPRYEKAKEKLQKLIHSREREVREILKDD